MKKQSIQRMVLAVLVLFLVAGTCLQAAEKPCRTARDIKAEVKAQAARALARHQIQLPKPDIREFSCQSLSEGYNLMLFSGPRGAPTAASMSASPFLPATG